MITKLLTQHARQPVPRPARQDLNRKIFQLQAENMALRTENNELIERLARYDRIAATCEELGCEGE